MCEPLWNLRAKSSILRCNNTGKSVRAEAIGLRMQTETIMSTINEALRGRAGVMAVAFSAAAVGLSRLHERASRRREQRRVATAGLDSPSGGTG